MADLLLLDTNILVHFVRSDPLWHRIRTRFSLMTIEPLPMISVVADGEIRSLAHQFNWKTDKTSQMRFALGYFQRVTIDTARTLEAYAAIDAYSQRIGQPMGKNDVWIAATANATGAKLLTTDHDFDILSPTFLDRIWIDLTTT
jgi:tRNA(fMet)-specific endonuclease VapC